HDGQPVEQLLANPAARGELPTEKPFVPLPIPIAAAALEEPAMSSTASPTSGPSAAQPVGAASTAATFRNQPPIDFADARQRDAMRAALDRVRGELGRVYPLIINNHPVETDRRTPSVDP